MASVDDLEERKTRLASILSSPSDISIADDAGSPEGLGAIRKKKVLFADLTLKVPFQDVGLSMTSLDDLEKTRGPSVFPSRDDVTTESAAGPSESRQQLAFAEMKPDDSEFPEGGWRAWSVVLGSWIFQFCNIGYVNGYGAYNDYYVRVYLQEKYTSTQISWIGSIQLFLLLSSGLLVGRATDVGYHRSLMIGGSTLFIFCMFMLSLSQPQQFYQVLLTQGIGVGIATGITFVPALALVPHYFHRRRALALGIGASGSAVGGAIHPIILNNLFHSKVGFHNGVRISTAILAVLLIVATLLSRPRLPPKPKKDGSMLKDLKMCLSDPPFLITATGTLFVHASIYYPIFFLQLLAIKNGIDSNTAFYMLVALNLSSAFGRIIPQFLVPKLGIYNLMILCVSACGALTFCMLALHTAVSAFAFAVFYGFFAGGYVGFYTPMIASLARDDTEIGARLGVSLGFSGFGCLAGSPIIGALLSGHFLWWRPTLFGATWTFTGALCFAMSRFIVARRKGTWKV